MPSNELGQWGEVTDPQRDKGPSSNELGQWGEVTDPSHESRCVRACTRIPDSADPYSERRAEHVTI